MPATRVSEAIAGILPPALQRRLLDFPGLLHAWPAVPEELRSRARPGSLTGATLTLLVPNARDAALVRRRRATIRRALLEAAHLPRANLKIEVVVNPLVFDGGGNEPSP